MGFLVPVAGAIIAAVTTVVAVVASVIMAVVGAVISALVAIGMAIYSATVGFVLGALEAFGLVTTMQGANLMYSLGALNAVGGAVYTSTFVAISTISTAFSAFLNAIHFKTLYKIHQIAYLISADYQRMVQKVLRQVASVSHALEMGASFLPLVLENMRFLVLDTSAMLGRSYDLAQIGWLKDLQGILTKIGKRAEVIQGRPELVLTMITDVFVERAINVRSQFMAGLLLTVENLLSASEEVITNVTTVRDRIDTLIADLPSFIKEKIQPEYEELTGKIDGFINKVYQPNLGRLEEVLNVMDLRVSDTKARVTNVVERIKKPGDYLSEIDLMDRIERLRQEDKVAEISSRRNKREVEEIYEITEEEQRKLGKISDALDKEIEPTPYGVPEVEGPARVGLGEIEPSLTWFVGDY